MPSKRPRTTGPYDYPSRVSSFQSTLVKDSLVPISISSPIGVEVESDTFSIRDNTDISPLSCSKDNCNQSDPCNAATNPLLQVPRGGLSAFNIYTQITSGHPLFTYIPNGQKDNKFLLVDNTRNTQRHQNKQRATFYDDLGVWNSSKGTTTKSYYVISQSFKYVFLKRNLYCASQVVKKQKNFRSIRTTTSPI